MLSEDLTKVPLPELLQTVRAHSIKLAEQATEIERLVKARECADESAKTQIDALQKRVAELVRDMNALDGCWEKRCVGLVRACLVSMRGEMDPASWSEINKAMRDIPDAVMTKARAGL